MSLHAWLVIRPPTPDRPYRDNPLPIRDHIGSPLTILAGLILLFRAGDEQLVLETGATSGSIRLTALVGILLGIIVAVVATSLGGGSGFARFLVTLVLILRMLFDIYLLALWGGAFLGATIISILILLLILFLLWNSKASRFFSPG